MKIKKYNDLLILTHLNKTEFVPLSQIVFCECYKGATKLHLAMPASVIAKDPLKEVIQIINDNSFIEINENQFLNKAYLKSYNETERLLITSLQHKLIFSK